MTEAVERLKTQVSTLSTAERADLAYFLLTSLEPEEEGVEDAWRKEIARRVTEIRSGQAVGRPVEEVLAELRERYPRSSSSSTQTPKRNCAMRRSAMNSSGRD
jgi:putative addiction module component (TIGR02574 family)